MDLLTHNYQIIQRKSMLVIVLFILCISCASALAVTNQWIPDNFTIVEGNVMYPGPWEWTIGFYSNGPIFQNGGHYRIALSIEAYINNSVTLYGESDCIPMGADPKYVESMINGISFQDNLQSISFPKLLKVVAIKYFSSTLNESNVKTEYGITFSGNPVLYLNASISTNNCSMPQTIMNWRSKERWSLNRIPVTTDKVLIPSGSGLIVLDRDISVHSIEMYDGVILSQSSSCPNGWISGPTSPIFDNKRSYSGEKCYRLYENITDFYSAASSCSNIGRSSIDSRLVEINDYEELDAVKRICQGSHSNSSARLHGCWIGLHDPTGSGSFQWIDKNAVKIQGFRDWRRFMKDNHTVSEGLSTPGELCTHIVQWQEDPLIVEQGSMNDIDCVLEKPYVCQLFATIHNFQITVTNSSLFLGGQIIGGFINLQGTVSVSSMELSGPGTLYIGSHASSVNLGNLILSQGSVLHLENCTAVISNTSWIGARVDSSVTSDMIPLVYLSTSHTKLVAISTCASCSSSFDANINARVEGSGNIYVDSNVVLNIKQGGDISRSKVTLATDTSTMVLGGYGMKLSSFDSFDLYLSHSRPVVGEYFHNYLKEDGPVVGVYRLIVTDYAPSHYGSTTLQERVNVTKCIPYNATADELKTYIADFPAITSRGGVTIRRYGDGNVNFKYGYSFRLDIDSPSIDVFDWGPISIAFYCQGIAECGCAETKVPMQNLGLSECPLRVGNSSMSDPGECAIPPSISMKRITTQSFTQTSGNGTLVIGNGLHRLPPKCHFAISSFGGRGIVGSDVISWKTFGVDAIGTVVFTGTSWWSWDSALVLFEASWEYLRGFVKELSSVPPFTMTADQFYVGGFGSVYSAAPNSNISWKNGTWAGGSIGGRCTVIISQSMIANGNNKALHDAVTLWILSTASLEWITGNISLADGADMIIEGKMLIKTVGTRQYIGQAVLLSAPQSQPESVALLQTEMGRNWHGYFDLSLPMELWGGWYQNPLCGSQCLAVNQITIRDNGVVNCVELANVGFVAPLNLIGYSKLYLGTNGTVDIFSGGICGNDVVMDMAAGTNVVLSGGNFQMRATCTIQGQGELFIAEGTHDLAFSIAAHITINGGILRWPLSRGTKKTINFNGGLLIQNVGTLQVEPFSTTIIVHKEVHLKDSCSVIFPMIGIAAQAAPSDRQDAPDSSPRGNFTVSGIFRWDGGTLLGKADFNSMNILYIDGTTKYIRSLGKMVNYGHCEWGTGDIITDDNAGFLNKGTIQMRYGTSNYEGGVLMKGTIVPVENGGDVFANNYHSWDMDEGRLSYQEYITLRTLFVSRAPNGWTEQEQLIEQVVHPLRF